MKILFLVFHGFDAFNGISKKIGYQIEALRILGHQVELGSLAVDERGRWKRMGGDRVVEDLGAGIVGKLKKKMALRFARPLHRRGRFRFRLHAFRS